jgi:hypothetical protein
LRPTRCCIAATTTSKSSCTGEPRVSEPHLLIRQRFIRIWRYA